MVPFLVPLEASDTFFMSLNVKFHKIGGHEDARSVVGHHSAALGVTLLEHHSLSESSPKTPHSAIDQLMVVATSSQMY